MSIEMFGADVLTNISRPGRF